MLFFFQWQQISTANFDGNCSNNLSRFRVATESGTNGPVQPNTLQILFTVKGSDCGGIAYVGSPGSAGANKRM